MTEYGQLPERLSAGASRQVGSSPGDVRTALLQAIRGLGFATSREQYSLLEAERGSKLKGLTLTRARVPVALRVDLQPDGTGTAVQIRLEDRWPVLSTRRSAVAVYADVFTETLAALDAALARVDPAAATAFSLWWRTIPEHEVAAGRARADGASRTERVMARSASRLLDGPRSGPTTALAQAQLTTVTLVAPDSVTQLQAEVVDAMLTVGKLVASHPGTMPPKLVAEVQETVLLLEQRTAAVATRGVADGLTIQVDADAIPVITFLFQQASLREELPVRVLMRCTTCRLEKVVNPDLAKLRERNRRMRVLSTSVGAMFGTHQISPFILVGRLSQMKKTEPDFVCQRCQGTDADQRPITFCSRCGERLDGSVLRGCPKCKLDLRTLVRTTSVWNAIEAPPAAGYYADPWGRADQRYWDGAQWTPHVVRDGLAEVDGPSSA